MRICTPSEKIVVFQRLEGEEEEENNQVRNACVMKH